MATTIVGLMSIFGFTAILFIALMLESAAKALHARGWTMHKIKFEFISRAKHLINKIDL